MLNVAVWAVLTSSVAFVRAVTIAEPAVAVLFTLTVNVAEVAPAGTVTVRGASCRFELTETLNVYPPVGAGEFK